MYYLQSRYYNPELGRFINADVFTSTGQGILGNNMFAYCGNNPVFRTDENGKFFTLLGAITGFIGGAVSALVDNLFNSKDNDLIDSGIDGAIGGAISGAGVDASLLMLGTFGTALPVVALAVGTSFFAGGIGNSYTTYASSDGKATEYDMDISFIIGGVANMVSLGLSTNCIASSVDELFYYGNTSFTANFWSGAAVAVSSGIATTIGISAGKNHKNRFSIVYGG